MAESTLWWLLAGGIVAAELLTGTFYLLMLALGVAAAAIAAHLRYPRCRYHKIFLFWPTAVRTSAILSCLTISLQHSPCRLLSRIIIQVSLFLFFSVVPLRHLLAVQLCIAFAPVPSSLGRRCQ